jgi:Na+/alanine symporter
MRGNPFLNFHRTAEARGYPALLIVSVVCLALVVTPVLLLSLTDAGWVLALALLNLVVAIAVLAGEVLAALSDYAGEDRRAA